MSRIVALGIILAFAGALGAQTYTINTVAGGALPVNVPALSASLGNVKGVAIDSDGNVFLLASDYHIVLRLDASSGMLSRIAGNGTSGFSGDGGAATSAELTNPQSIAIDTAGALFIADSGHNVIRKVSNGVITTVAGNGTSGFSGDGGPALSSQLNFPFGVAVGSSGDIFILDATNRIRKVSNGVISTVAGNGTYGFSGDNGPATNAAMSPSAIAVDSAGNLYIAEGANSRIRKVSNGEIITVAGDGTFGFRGDTGPAASAQLNGPTGIAVDSAGNLFIADEGNRRIRKISKGVISTVAGNGIAGLAGDGGPAISAELVYPGAVAVDASGNLFITDSGTAGRGSQIRRVSASGIITTVAGNGTGFAGDNGPASLAQLDLPYGVAVDAAGNVYIADTFNLRVRKVSNGVITTAAGNGSYLFSGDGGPASSAGVNPTDVVVDSAGNLFIDDSNVIREVSDGVITTVAGNGTYGSGGDGGPALNGQWSFSDGMAVDSSGNLYIADTGNNIIREVSHGIITTVAGNRTQSFSGDNGPATNASLNFPFAAAVDSSGNLYIADSQNARIRKVSNGIITTVAGDGTQGFSGDGVSATSAELGFPWGIAVDPSGNLYFGDSDYNGKGYIRKVSGGIITNIAGGGAALGDGGPADVAQLSAPSGIAVDAAGNIYIADVDNNRIRVLTPSGPSCAYAVSPLTVTPSSFAGTLSATIQTGSTCAWAVQNLPDWTTITGGALGSGSSTITLAFAANSGPVRSAQVSIAGASLTVNQASGILAVSPGGVANAARFTSPVAPGSIAAIFGNFLVPSPLSASTLPVPNSLGGLSLQFGGSLATPLFYADFTQVNAQVPWELAGQSQTTVTANTGGQMSAPQSVSLAAYAPGIFTMNGQGTGQGAILDLNYHLVSSTNPTTAGAYVQIYCTGLGPVTNQPATGMPSPGNPLAWTTTTPLVVIGGAPATVQFSGLAPGDVGLYQVNAQVPAGAAKGSAVYVAISIGGASSNTVTMAVE